MAKYTYADFEAEAKKAGLWDSFSSADLKLAQENPDAGISILNYKKDYLNATTDELRAAANAGAESIRSSYGNYTGGATGSGYYLNELSPQDYDAPTVDSFTYESAPSYESRYDEQIQDMLGTVTNYGSFSYDAANDPLMQQYTKMYAREGQRATQDALGEAAALTGGMPSSYAVSAAAQAGNYYAAQAADKMPELYELAYNQYLNDFNLKLSQLSALQGAEESDYMKFTDELNQYNADRNFDYAQYLDSITQQNNERDFAYNQLVDEINNTYVRDEAALNKALNAAAYGDYSLLENLGITPDLAALTAGTSDTTSQTEAAEGADGEDVVYTNEIDEENNRIKVSGKWYTIDEVNQAVAAGSIVKIKNADGSITFQAEAALRRS